METLPISFLTRKQHKIYHALHRDIKNQVHDELRSLRKRDNTYLVVVIPLPRQQGPLKCGEAIFKCSLSTKIAEIHRAYFKSLDEELDDELTWYYAGTKVDGRYTVNSLLEAKTFFAKGRMCRDKLIVIHTCDGEEEEGLKAVKEGKGWRYCHCDGYNCGDEVDMVDLTKGESQITNARRTRTARSADRRSGARRGRVIDKQRYYEREEAARACSRARHLDREDTDDEEEVDYRPEWLKKHMEIKLEEEDEVKEENDKEGKAVVVDEDVDEDEDTDEVLMYNSDEGTWEKI